MKIPFVKMQGTGNDFIIIDRNDLAEININKYSRFLNDRHFGIGGDGLIIIDKAGDLYKMTMINPDGSEAMCGNGIRCFGLYLVENNLVNQSEFTVASIAGDKKLKHFKDGDKHYFTVDMGEPIFEAQKIPVKSKLKNPVIDLPLKVGENIYKATCLSMGNPHAVIFVDDYETIDTSKVGSSIEYNENFPERTNVEFIRIIDKNNIEMKVWERGAGLTLACGTGTCASVVASSLKGFVNEKVKVFLPGGEVDIEYNGENVLMTGEAKTVFTGVIDSKSMIRDFKISY